MLNLGDDNVIMIQSVRLNTLPLAMRKSNLKATGPATTVQFGSDDEKPSLLNVATKTVKESAKATYRGYKSLPPKGKMVVDGVLAVGTFFFVPVIGHVLGIGFAIKTVLDAKKKQ
jgi:hypothetical protein